ncbi:hypothetical protein A9Q02_03785 [Candidatus Chloroploca asiatica]|uniref:DUF4258 domain-containing protein n=1 Tax=Candidatus Chloroploca asiatica TaxID=1506545 RepID=A0A2H3L5R5_9CHLR|nr:hypothetical protein A9Q02_03785 [Candidatus Chloroploca asiatica]
MLGTSDVGRLLCVAHADSLLTGEIVERQKDAVTGEWKYLVKGDTVAGYEMTTVAKISPTGKLVIITVYRL